MLEDRPPRYGARAVFGTEPSRGSVVRGPVPRKAPMHAGDRPPRYGLLAVFGSALSHKQLFNFTPESLNNIATL